MGGMVTVMARLKDNRKISFRMSTGNLKAFYDYKNLDEDYFLKFISDNGFYLGDAGATSEHDDYESRKCFFAPYNYGLIFFDFKNQTLFSTNNHSGFFLMDSWLVKSQYEDLAEWFHESSKNTVYDLMVKRTRYEDNKEIVLSEHNVFNGYFERFKNIFYIAETLRYNGSFILKDQALPEGMDVLQTLAYVYGKDLLSTNSNVNENSSFGMKWSDCCDLSTTIPNWTIHHGDGGFSYISKVFDYVKNENLLNEVELKYWTAYLDDAQKRDNDE